MPLAIPFATHLLEDGYDIPTIPELRDHKAIRPTMISHHILNIFLVLNQKGNFRTNIQVRNVKIEWE